MEFPQDFTVRERALLGARFDELYAYATPQPARGVTVNALRCTPEWFAQHADFDAKPSPFCPTAFTTAADFRPGRHAWHHAGVLYAQEPSASAPAALLDVQPGMRVADLCAAPGGKTSQLAAALQGQGLLLANEFVAARATHKVMRRHRLAHQLRKNANVRVALFVAHAVVDASQIVEVKAANTHGHRDHLRRAQ